MPELPENNYHVESPEDLQQLLGKVPAASSPRFAADTEADSLHSYKEKLCLLQFSSGDVHAIIDPLSLSTEDLTPLVDLLHTGEVWMHGADFDITMLKRRFDRVPEKVLDTQTAARLCGTRQFGLANLIQDVFQVTLSKQSQRANWGKRPLLEKMVEYALNDVRYILPLADHYSAKLHALGRYDWFLESCEDARDVVMNRPPRDAEEAWRINGSGRLKPQAMAYLRALWNWRDGEAERLDRPSFKVIGNEDLLKFSEMLMAGQEPRLPERFRPSSVRRFEKAIRDAAALTSDEWPKRRHGIRAVRTTETDKRFEELRKRRDAVAEELDLDPSLIASRGVLESISLFEDRVEENLLKWQRNLLNL